jgi:hypothetical protein
VNARSWSRGALFGVASRKNAVGNVMTFATQMTDAFANDYLKANPKGGK